jgi:hypothetical protein
MRLLWSAAVIAAAASSASAFAPVNNGAALARSSVAMSAVATADVKAKQDASIEKLKAKDASSAALSKDVSYHIFFSCGVLSAAIKTSIVVAVAVAEVVATWRRRRIV